MEKSKKTAETPDDFVEALGLNKDELADHFKTFMEDHFKNSTVMSEAIRKIVKTIKDREFATDIEGTKYELTLFLCGLIAGMAMQDMRHEREKLEEMMSMMGKMSDVSKFFGDMWKDKGEDDEEGFNGFKDIK